MGSSRKTYLQCASNKLYCINPSTWKYRLSIIHYSGFLTTDFLQSAGHRQPCLWPSCPVISRTQHSNAYYDIRVVSPDPILQFPRTHNHDWIVSETRNYLGERMGQYNMLTRIVYTTAIMEKFCTLKNSHDQWLHFYSCWSHQKSSDRIKAYQNGTKTVR